MPSRLSELQPASFKGVSFLVKNESVSEAGRKIALHEYPDSDKRFVEDLGRISEIYRVSAFISGDNWLEDSRTLDNVLTSKGSGALVIPQFGSLNAYALPYTKDSSQSSIGIISYSQEFALGKPADAPAAALATKEQVFADGDTARAVLQTELAEKLEPPTFVDSVIAGIGDLKDSASEVLSTVADSIDIESLQGLVAKVQKITVTATRLINDPEQLAIEMLAGITDDPGVWQLVSLGYGVQGALSNLETLSNYGDSLLTSDSSDEIRGSSVVENDEDETSSNTPYWNETTQERILRNDFRRTLVQNNRVNALVAMYEQLSAGEYATTQDIIDARNLVESRNKAIMLDDPTGSDSLQSLQSVRNAISAVRLSSLEVLRQKAQESFEIVTIKQKVPTSKYVLSYNLYAEEFTESQALEDRSTIIGALNPDQNNISLFSNVSVIQNEV